MWENGPTILIVRFGILGDAFFFFIIGTLLQPEPSEAMQDFTVTVLCVDCIVLTVRKLHWSIQMASIQILISYIFFFFSWNSTNQDETLQTAMHGQLKF